MDIEVKENFEIKNLTTFKIGGNVEKVFFPKTSEEFVYLLNELNKPLILGNCSNVLFSSNGFKGSIILTSKMRFIEVKGTKIYAECGVLGAELSQLALKNSLSGFEFMSCFPGSIGGNVCMNAGAHGQSISDTLIYAKIFDLDNKEVKILTNEQLEFGYRKSLLQNKNYVLISAEFEGKKENQNTIAEKIRLNKEARSKTQPGLRYPNAGSVFKNPENNSAGKLLEESGAKSLSVNDAEVWQNHANFIVNKGSATSEDVLELMYKMYCCVKDKQGIKLRPEVRYFGDKTSREEEICRILY